MPEQRLQKARAVNDGYVYQPPDCRTSDAQALYDYYRADLAARLRSAPSFYVDTRTAGEHGYGAGV